MEHKEYTFDAVELLKQLIAIPSVSREEQQAADLLEQTMKQWGLNCQREANNIWVVDPHFDDNRPTLLLNAHIDTVKPVSSWTYNPFVPVVEDDVLYGLGSNDCGGGLVSLLQVYRLMAERPRSYNLVYLASAEEEVSGNKGISLVLPLLPKIDVAIVGEPTGMLPAIAEKGLMVIDGYAYGTSGHAARNEGVNAIYEALDDLVWLRDYRFRRESPLLGPTKMSVTVVEAGTQHNVVPDKPFGSPTLSDQALMPFPSFKLGPGDSARSHAANEFIRISEIEKAIETYVELLTFKDGSDGRNGNNGRNGTHASQTIVL